MLVVDCAVEEMISRLLDRGVGESRIVRVVAIADWAPGGMVFGLGDGGF